MAYKIGQQIKAKFPGVCKVTGKAINVGDTIVYGSKGWSLAPKETAPVTGKDPIQPKHVDELWWKTDLAQLIGKELTKDFDLAQPITLVAWDVDAKKLINLICVTNKYTKRNFVFTGMFDAARAYRKASDGQIVQQVNGNTYVAVEGIDDETWAMDSVVGDPEDYYFSRNRKLKIEELVAKGYAYEDAAEAVYNGMYD